MNGLPKGLVTLNNNLLSVVDTETTGLTAGYHDLIQAAVVPLDEDLNLLDVSPFEVYMKPEFPKRTTKKAMEKNGLSIEELLDTAPSKWDAAEMFEEWFQELGLPMAKKLVWLTHNAPHDIPFMKAWLGEAAFYRYFYYEGRDSMFYCTGLNDAAAFKCRPVPFPDRSLKGLCKQFGIVNIKAHDALSDCIATGGVYRELLRWEG